MRLKSIFISLLLIILNYLVICIKQPDYDCIQLLANNIGDNNLTSSVCSSNGGCTSDGSILKLTIDAKNGYIISRSDLKCFPLLTSITGLNINLNSTFLYETGTPNISEIKITNSNIQRIDDIVTPLSNFVINSLSYSKVKLLYLKNVVRFETGSLISIDALDIQSTSKLSQMILTLNDIPDFSNSNLSLTKLEIYPGPSFNDSSMSNIKTIKSLNQFYIRKLNDIEIEFPYNIVDVPNLNLFFVNNKIKPSNKLIDLSKTNITNIYLYLNGSNFNYNGEMPFSAVPKTISTFTYSGGNLTNLPDLKIFSNSSVLTIANSNIGGTIPKKVSNWILNNFNFNGNSLTGSIDETWCTSLLSVSNNLLSGMLPKCFYCYLGDPIISNRLSNNGFDNFNKSSICSYDDIYISRAVVSTGSIGLIGKNLGFNGLNIKCSPETQNSGFTFLSNGGFLSQFKAAIILNVTKKVEISFNIPQLNFTISTGNYIPMISGVFQSKNNIQINGEFFSYDKSSINVTIGGTICNVSKSTFFNIQCNIEFPVMIDGDFTLQVNASGLLGTFPINIKKTVSACLPYDCFIIGTCQDDDTSGSCVCDYKYTTIDPNNICSIPNHYISSSTQVLSTFGGTIELNGWFGNVYSLNQLIINGRMVSINKINSTTLEVTIEKGEIGPVNVNYTQNGLIWTGLIYPYYNTIKSCPSNCYAELNQGKCNTVTGNCECNSNFTGFDCKLQINKDDPSSETNVINNGSTIITNQDIQFLISIDNIQEIDFNNNMVDLFNLTNNWILNNKSDSITTFKQILMNNITQLSLTIEEVNKSDKTFNFANNIFTISKGGFKISISITDWVFKSNLNTLQIQISTDLTTEIINNNNNNCNQDIQIESLSSNNDDYNKILNGINYLKVSKNGKTLYGRFQDKILSDGRENIIITKISSQDDKSVKVILNLPHCTQCLIDPDFSLLVNPNFQSSCKDGDNDNSRKWVIPVAVVISVVGAATLIIVGFIIYKRSTILKVQVHKLKRFNKN
ncbi:hypothetical protein ACTA71_008928 [Dictyostelium dimigraforme]